MPDDAPSDDALALARELLAPMSPDAFLDEVYAKRPRILSAGDAHRFDGLLSLAEIENRMRGPNFFETVNVDLRLANEIGVDTVANMATVYERLSKGDALQLLGFQRALSEDHELMRMLRALEEVCQAPAQGLAVFLAPPGATLPKHHDPYDTFTLQLSGRKAWYTYDFAGSPLSLDPEAEPVEVFELGPGDIFYMPKHLTHHVEPRDSVSFSVALVLRPTTWLKLIDDLNEAVAGDRLFWQALPPTDVAAGFEARRAALIDLLQGMDADVFAARVRAEHRAALPGLPAPHLETCFGIDDIGVDTMVRRRPGPAPIVTEVGGRAILVTAFDEPIAAPPRVRAAFDFIAAADGRFRVADICATLSDESKVTLVRKLARRGIVQIAAD